MKICRDDWLIWAMGEDQNIVTSICGMIPPIPSTGRPNDATRTGVPNTISPLSGERVANSVAEEDGEEEPNHIEDRQKR
jgi:hypothetical protein